MKPFNPQTESEIELFIELYRAAVHARDEARDEPARQEYQRIVDKLRLDWKAWEDDDSLHEAAFGEPRE